MTDQTLDAPATTSAEPKPIVVARALQPTAAFWLAMYAASALGANLGDFWADDLGLGLPTSFSSLGVICLLMVWGDRENGRSTEVFYWLAIVCLRAVATNAGDFITHTLHIDYLLATVVLGAATLVLGYITLPVSDSASPRIDLRYWAAMFAGGVFGTIGGDLVSHNVGLFLSAILLGVVLLMVIRARSLIAPGAMVSYWCVVLAERAAGTPMGDLLAKARGLNLGLPISVLLTGSVVLVALWMRGGTRQTRDSSFGLGTATRVLLPILRLALLVLSLAGGYYMMEIYFVEHPRAPYLALSYGVGLAVNAVYLGIQELDLFRSSRLARLVSLLFAIKRREFDRWAEAKETELRNRLR